MNIWQWILVILPVIKFGAALHDIYVSGDKTERKIGRGVGTLLFSSGYLFVLYRAGVLIIQ